MTVRLHDQHVTVYIDTATPCIDIFSAPGEKNESLLPAQQPFQLQLAALSMSGPSAGLAGAEKKTLRFRTTPSGGG